jgi:hypothetical protein
MVFMTCRDTPDLTRMAEPVQFLISRLLIVDTPPLCVCIHGKVARKKQHSLSDLV